MFYGMPSRIVNKEGKPIHGTLGFVGALLKMMRIVEPTHVAVLFDGESYNERKVTDPSYKANRPDYSEMPENEVPFSQLPDIYKSLDILNIKHKETSVCETDDWIASYALSYGKDNEIIIASFDSDFFQLVNENIKVLRYRGDNSIICNEDYIKNRFGIDASRYAFFKALTGDTSDNVRGVEKVGPKTAALLVNRFVDIDGLISNINMIEKKSVRESVARNIDRIVHNYKLIKLDGGLDLPFNIDQIVYDKQATTTKEVLSKIGLI